ncbi:formate/nitrite transporter family protein [Clostridium algidicarnis]|uniref:Formate/nitrite transporter family protein n=1 Tax=Clostridium algidicarnis TaxID=37659 RepID=A0ABS6C035_9CLOT|nr:formate/nitrite transporter family protein [Clostridium algidicarnis]MBB6631610.1 formate/nitrite transporter family protein [Clostridium algidicarnis]MBB6697961.1 formate/nitrite transporter family protein [Clostridium algidicarnis]MBU3203644.1 formate/nitrite transporter family protein [Clostridium algidicarnis]MBU3211798.1 formate/nitrite transporter family protein [Clostridium algidicarnis]MBU3218848.1 formate/nitrite transporter family protein [Clostridium algidicarnis]
MEKRMLNPTEIASEVITTYEAKANYAPLKSLILGVLSGMFIALGGFASATASHSITNYSISKLIAGAVFPVGLILVIITGTDLFTGNVLLTVPLLHKKITFKQLIKNWVIVYFANMAGAIIVSLLLFYGGSLDVNHGALGAYSIKVAYTKSSLPFIKSFLSGILCNILVCLSVWMSFAGKDIISKIFAIFFPIMAFVVSGFEHSVANMYYFSIGLLAKTNLEFVTTLGISESQLQSLNLKNIISNLVPVTLGNIVGGAIFVGAALYLAFIRTNKV